MSYNSKYTGQQVENLLDQVASGNAGGGGGGITTEIDPIFSASPSAKITDVDIEEWNSKQDVISDLESIRNNASKGAQALDAIPTKVSQLENDEGYLTSHQDISGLATKDELQGKVDKVDGKQLSTEDFTTLLKQKLDSLSNYDDTEISQAVSKLRTDLDTLVSGDTTTAIKTFNEVIAFLDGIEDSQSLDSIIASIEQQIAGKMDNVTLAAVATSGNYNDLSNKPTIPTAVTESTVSGWGFTKNTGTYSKPSSGIPKSDLESSVQTSLNKADTALQSYTEQYKGTVTGVKVNGSTKSPSSGTVDIGNVVTSIKINGSTKSPSSGAVDLGTVITSHQDISGKQDKLVSGTNIKTINGNSILGSGDIVISGSSSSGGSGAYPKEFYDITIGEEVILQPNIYYIINAFGIGGDSVFMVDINFDEPSNDEVVNEYIFSISVEAGFSFSLPDSISWANNDVPKWEYGKNYEVSIIDNYACYAEFQTI